MKRSQDEQKGPWQKTPYANLIRYVPSHTYFARIRIRGKLIVKSLKTDSITVAKLRLADLEKDERHAAEHRDVVATGRMTFGDCLDLYRQRLKVDPNFKPKTKVYYEERTTALLKSWPGLEAEDVRKVTKSECLDWAARFRTATSASAFNHTISLLRRVFEIGVEAGARYDNPGRFIKRASERPKALRLPEHNQFDAFVKEVERPHARFSWECADLVRFLAYGGFRIHEAGNIKWGDVDFTRQKIVVRGDAETGLKGRVAGEVRQVPMIPDMREFLERLRKDRPNEPDDAPVMRVRECQKAMDRAAKAVGMTRITHHDLRHLFATRCIESGVDIPTVSRWLGHRDGGALAMRTYGHLRDEHSTDMAQRVTFKKTIAAETTTPGQAASMKP
ncbi:MAG: site-specific integrase [Verrucomicrobiia bacterium]|jgi:integrase